VLPSNPVLKRSFFKSREHKTQVEFFNLLSRVNHPAVALTVAIPNQAIALLTKVVAVHFKHEGVKAGFPDTVAFYPSPHRSGLLIIEFKKPGDAPRANQLLMLKLLAEAGHNCYVCDEERAAFGLWCEHYGIKVSF
jgi:hypothetical protein